MRKTDDFLRENRRIRAGNDEVRIFHVESGLNWGGQEARITVEVEWLNKNGYPAWIVADPRSEIYQRGLALKLPVLPLSMPNGWNLCSLFRLWLLVRKYQVNVINTHSSKDSWLCLPLHWMGYPIFRWRNVTNRISSGWRKTFLYRHGCRKIIATAEVIRQNLHQAGVSLDKIEVMGEGIDLEKFSNQPSTLRQELGLSPDAPLIGMAAMMRSEKGHSIFLDAAIEVLKRRPEARFVIAGGCVRQDRESRIFAELRGKISSLSAISRNTKGEPARAIILLGYREDMGNVLSALDIVVVPSLMEARSRVLAESMSMGKPVVVSNVGGMVEVIQHQENGFLFPSGDVAALTSILVRLLDDPSGRMTLGENAKKTAQQNLSLDAVMKKILLTWKECQSTKEPAISMELNPDYGSIV